MRSNGSIRIDIYPSGQLGMERECIELVQIGSLAMTRVSSSVMEGFPPAFKVYSLPKVLLDTASTTAIVMLLIGTSMGMSWILAYTSIPRMSAQH